MRFRLLNLMVGALTCFGVSFAQQSTTSSGCLSYEPTMVKVSGTLIQKTFPGPPNYESVRKGDKAEVDWLVELRSPVCVTEDKADPDLNPSQDRIHELQLVLSPEAFKDYRNLMGRDVVAQGTLFGAHTGHHHTPVLLTVSSIKPAR